MVKEKIQSYPPTSFSTCLFVCQELINLFLVVLFVTGKLNHLHCLLSYLHTSLFKVKEKIPFRPPPSSTCLVCQELINLLLVVVFAAASH